MQVQWVSTEAHAVRVYKSFSNIIFIYHLYRLYMFFAFIFLFNSIWVIQFLFFPSILVVFLFYFFIIYFIFYFILFIIFIYIFLFLFPFLNHIIFILVLLGASGAVAALFTWSILYNPTQMIMVYGVLPVPIALFGGLFLLNQIGGEFNKNEDNVVTQLGGISFGALYFVAKK